MSNIENGGHRDAPRSFFIHSKMETAEVDSSGAVPKPIRTLASLYKERYPNARLSEDRRDPRRLADGSHYEVLRRALNTVGKPGEPGERVRCVVSVGMITEGWDAGTVTHMIGFRAFGSQLLCEQVGGRTLRRRVYEVEEDGKFTPEYSMIFGVPWDYVRAGEKPSPGPNPVPRPIHTVHLLPGREHHGVRWPNVVGYDVFGGDSEATIGVEDWNAVEKLSLNEDEMRRTTLASIPCGVEDASAKVELARERGVIVACDEPVYDETVGTERRLSDWLMRISAVGERVRISGIEAKLEDEGAPLKFCAPFQEYETGREHVYETVKSEISHAVCDSGWEVAAARALDLRTDVIGWVRNERLNRTIPWMDESGGVAVWRRYCPDFAARIDAGEEREMILVIEIKGQERKDDSEKRRYAEDCWIPSVNAHPDFQKLGRWEYLYVTHPERLDGMIDEAKRGFAKRI